MQGQVKKQEDRGKRNSFSPISEILHVWGGEKRKRTILNTVPFGGTRNKKGEVRRPTAEISAVRCSDGNRRDGLKRLELKYRKKKNVLRYRSRKAKKEVTKGRSEHPKAGIGIVVGGGGVGREEKDQLHE